MSKPVKITSNFMSGDIVDLVGAGDSFRAGLVGHVARNIRTFESGRFDFAEAVQMGNLFASLYIKAPLNDRYGHIAPYERMLTVLPKSTDFQDFEAVISHLKS